MMNSILPGQKGSKYQKESVWGAETLKCVLGSDAVLWHIECLEDESKVDFGDWYTPWAALVGNSNIVLEAYGCLF